MEPKQRKKRKLARFIVYKFCKGWSKFRSESWKMIRGTSICLLVFSIAVIGCTCIGMALRMITFGWLPIFFNKEIIPYACLTDYFNTWFLYGFFTLMIWLFIATMVDNNKGWRSRIKKELKQFDG